MIDLNNEQSIFFDCDETLIFDPRSEGFTIEKLHELGVTTVEIKDPHDGVTRTYVVHNKHVKLLKDHKSRGFFVGVWSNNGSAYSKAVVTALGLTDFVGVTMAKPLKVVDDQKIEETLKARVYIEEEFYIKLLKDTKNT